MPPQHQTTKDLCIPFTTWRALVRNADAHPTTAPSSTTKTPNSNANKPASPAATRLPPGMVLDENGKPCKVCNSWRTWAHIPKKRAAGTGEAAAVGTFGSLAASSTTTSNSASQSTPHPQPTSETSEEASPQRPADCPPDVETLGRATWTFLHTTAAYYPVHPSAAQQKSMRSLIAGVADFYPCSYCRKDFAERVKESEPDVSGRTGLSRWMCERHNEVNARLGKEAFDCAKVLQRWKDGPPDGSCD